MQSLAYLAARKVPVLDLWNYYKDTSLSPSVDKVIAERITLDEVLNKEEFADLDFFAQALLPLRTEELSYTLLSKRDRELLWEKKPNLSLYRAKDVKSIAKFLGLCHEQLSAERYSALEDTLRLLDYVMKHPGHAIRNEIFWDRVRGMYLVYLKREGFLLGKFELYCDIATRSLSELFGKILEAVSDCCLKICETSEPVTSTLFYKGILRSINIERDPREAWGSITGGKFFYGRLPLALAGLDGYVKLKVLGDFLHAITEGSYHIYTKEDGLLIVSLLVINTKEFNWREYIYSDV